MRSQGTSQGRTQARRWSVGTGAGSRSRVGALLLMALVALVALAGCDSGNVSVTSTRATPTPTIPPTGALTLQQAWGSPTIHQLPEALGHGQVFALPLVTGDATPDAQWLIGTSQPQNWGTATGTSLPSYAVLYNVATRQIKTMAQLQSPRYEIIGASADADWVAWIEADPRTNAAVPGWYLFAYNRHTSQVRQVAQAARDANGQPLDFAASGPYVNHGIVLWGQAIGDVNQSAQNEVVREEDLSTGQVTTLGTGITPIGLSWPWAAWVSANVDAQSATFHNLATGQETSVHWATFPEVAGTSSAYLLDPSQIQLVDNFAGSAPPITLSPPGTSGGANVQWLSLSSRLVAWQLNGAPGPGPVVYDRLLRRFVILPYAYLSQYGGPFVWTGGNTLVWEYLEPPTSPGGAPTTTLDVLDTSTLPTHAG